MFVCLSQTVAGKQAHEPNVIAVNIKASHQELVSGGDNLLQLAR